MQAVSVTIFLLYLEALTGLLLMSLTPARGGEEKDTAATVSSSTPVLGFYKAVLLVKYVYHCKTAGLNCP